ncbi:MAG: CDP-alcohol phosphatidyltransferase family protein [Spirochaetota bacterium]|jgi:phosphatidylglycerophosphate synthase/GTP:adenosylcobinamide-phosphate guanylyltransferase|nr:CDP-alcohol phosphatidyltransferase family protein [Spirochaetota bacterium]
MVISQAVIFSHSGTMRVRRLCGHPLIARSIIAAARAGVRDFFVVCDEGAEQMQAFLAANRVLARQGCAVTCRDAADLKAERFTDTFLLLSDTAVYKESVLARLPGIDLAESSCCLIVDMAGNVSDGQKAGAVWTGLALCRAHIFPKLLEAFIRSPDTGLTLIFDSRVSGYVPMTDGYAVDVRNKLAYKRARRALLASVRKASDGVVSRYLNRPISIRISRVCMVLGFSPNFISGVNLLLTLLSAALIALGGYWNFFWGGILYQLTSIIDGSDGEVARLTWRMSQAGARFDTFCDQLGYFLFFIALPLGLCNSPREETAAYMLPELGSETFLVLGGGVLLGLACMFFVMLRYIRRTGSEHTFQIINDVEKAAQKTGGIALLDRCVSKMAFLFRHDFFALAAMVILMLNLAGAFMWFMAGVIWVLVVYLAWFAYRR